MKNVRNFLAALLVVAPIAMSVPAHAQVKVAETDVTKLYITLNTAGTFQTLEQKNAFNAADGKSLGHLTSGFQTAFGDLGFIGKFGEKEEVEMYFDLYLASRNHPSTTYGNQGYLVLHGIPENLGGARFLQPIFDRIDIKAGAFLIDFGDHLLHRSNNAITQNNRLVGNYVIDPELVAVGGEVMSKPGRFNWLVGVTNGTNTEDFTPGRGIAYNAKVWAFPIKPVRVAISGLRADHSDSVASRAALFAGNRGGERYAAVLGGGQAPGQVLPQAGRDITAIQLDGAFEGTSPLKLYGNFGKTRDKDTNGAANATHPEESWTYYAGDAAWYFTPNVYAAARYSAANADKINDLNSNGKVDRIQIGGGLWLTRNMLVKVEWVEQKYTGFVQGNVMNNGVAAWRDPEFKGLVSEFSFAF
jgi:hypothetical protein